MLDRNHSGTGNVDGDGLSCLCKDACSGTVAHTSTEIGHRHIVIRLYCSKTTGKFIEHGWSGVIEHQSRLMRAIIRPSLWGIHVINDHHFDGCRVSAEGSAACAMPALPIMSMPATASEPKMLSK